MLDMLLVALFQVAAGDPLAAAPADTAPAAEPAAAAPAAEPATAQRRMRCRKVRTTGSMISQRVCVARDDEEQRSTHARESLDELVSGIDTRQMNSGGFAGAGETGGRISRRR